MMFPVWGLGCWSLSLWFRVLQGLKGFCGDLMILEAIIYDYMGNPGSRP